MYPADHALGLTQGGCTPGMQEMAALMVSKMPVGEACEVMERISGVRMSRAKLDREARRQGERARRERARLDAQMSTAEGVAQMECTLPQEPFTLVMEVDAWNIRERDKDWGRSEELRKEGREPERWHWVYGATRFRLSQRVRSEAGRPMILSRGYVMTRGGIDELRSQLFAEASRHGLSRAAEVLVVADGAVWIWNLVNDRFPKARQRLDLYHAKQHLWALAEALHGAGTPEATEWVGPLLRQLETDQTPRLLNELRQALEGLNGQPRAHLQRTIGYIENNRCRLHYRDARERNAMNLWAAVPSNRPAGSISVASNALASLGPRPVTKRSWRWIVSGAITDSIFSSLTPLIPSPLPTCPEIETRPKTNKPDIKTFHRPDLVRRFCATHPST
jgi:hypothetical protein